MRRGMWEAPVPVEPGAEERGLEVVLAAYAERRPHRRHSPLPRLAVALAAAALLAALLLSPAGASVRDWVSDVFTETPQTARNGLAGIPGGGRLLVQSGEGPWIVAADGARHRLGDYAEASWSPHGLFVATAAGRELSAVAPDGDVHWSLTAPGRVRDPRWAPSGELIAYRAGAGLRLVAGDGSEARPLDDSVAPLAPSWSPGGAPLLAYVDARGALRILDVKSGRSVARATALPGIRQLEWSGDELLEASRRRLRVRRVGIGDAGAGGGAAAETRAGAGGDAGAETRAGAAAPAQAEAGERAAARAEAGAGAEDRAAARAGAGAGAGAADRAAAGRTVALGRPRQLRVPDHYRIGDAALSPAGGKVAALLGGRFAGVRRTDLVVYDLRRGGSIRPLTVPGRLAELAWSPDGRHLLVGWPRFDEWLFQPVGFARGRAVTGISRAFASGDHAAAFPRVAGWCCRR